MFACHVNGSFKVLEFVLRGLLRNILLVSSADDTERVWDPVPGRLDEGMFFPFPPTVEGRKPKVKAGSKIRRVIVAFLRKEGGTTGFASGWYLRPGSKVVPLDKDEACRPAANEILVFHATGVWKIVVPKGAAIEEMVNPLNKRERSELRSHLCYYFYGDAGEAELDKPAGELSLLAQTFLALAGGRENARVLLHGRSEVTPTT